MILRLRWVCENVCFLLFEKGSTSLVILPQICLLCALKCSKIWMNLSLLGQTTNTWRGDTASHVGKSSRRPCQNMVEHACVKHVSNSMCRGPNYTHLMMKERIGKNWSLWDTSFPTENCVNLTFYTPPFSICLLISLFLLRDEIRWNYRDNIQKKTLLQTYDGFITVWRGRESGAYS